MRLKPSATAPISSVLTTGQWPSRWPRSTRAMAASTSFSGLATLLAAKRARPTATTTPTPTKNSTVERQAGHDPPGGGRVGVEQVEPPRVRHDAEHRERDHRGEQEDGEQPDAHRQAGHARHRAQVAFREEEQQPRPPMRSLTKKTKVVVTCPRAR